MLFYSNPRFPTAGQMVADCMYKLIFIHSSLSKALFEQVFFKSETDRDQEQSYQQQHLRTLVHVHLPPHTHTHTHTCTHTESKVLSYPEEQLQSMSL